MKKCLCKSKDFCEIVTANEFEGQLECFRKNTENYKAFSVPIGKQVTNFDKDVNKSVNISYKVKFIDSAKYLPSSLLNFVDYFAKGIHKIKLRLWLFSWIGKWEWQFDKIQTLVLQ